MTVVRVVDVATAAGVTIANVVAVDTVDAVVTEVVRRCRLL